MRGATFLTRSLHSAALVAGAVSVLAATGQVDSAFRARAAAALPPPTAVHVVAVEHGDTAPLLPGDTRQRVVTITNHGSDVVRAVALDVRGEPSQLLARVAVCRSGSLCSALGKAAPLAGLSTGPLGGLAPGESVDVRLDVSLAATAAAGMSWRVTYDVSTA